MIDFVELEGFEFSKYDYEVLEQEMLDLVGYKHHNLGLSEDGINHVHGFSLGNLSKPVIYIQGGIHGLHEWRSPHWIIRFMEILVDPPVSHRLEIERLKSLFSFYFIPCLNPFGYYANKYVNANGVNLNRNFDSNWDTYPETEPWDSQYKGTAPFSEAETRMVRDVFNEIKPFVFVDVHTWGGFDGGALETEKTAMHYRVLYDGIVRSLKLINRDVQNSLKSGGPNQQRSADWAARRNSKNGIKCLSMAFEPGSNETEKEQSRIGINGLYLISLYAYHYFKKRTLNI